MLNYKNIRQICDENSSISASVVDNFLIYYAAERDNLDPEMERRFAEYSHITRNLQQEWTNRLKAQYLAHRIFMENGLIRKYLNHAEIKRLDQKKRDFLAFQAEHPWRFSFSIITGSPADCFYTMEDVFTEEEFLLYSPGIKETIRERPVVLWFNLISFNGACWQTYGLIIGYSSFEPEDILFFGAEMDDEVTSEQDLLESIEYDPVPYMMLISGADMPLVYDKQDFIVHLFSEYDIKSLDTRSMKGTFITEYTDGVYRLTSKKWGKYPHFSRAYYDEVKQIILLSSMTDRGFRALVGELNKFGNDFLEEPFLRVNMSMFSIASEILDRQIVVNEYASLFIKD